MKFKLEIINTPSLFQVIVKTTSGKKVYHCGWHGGEFQYLDKWYMVLGPYHGILPNDQFAVFELTQVSEVA